MEIIKKHMNIYKTQIMKKIIIKELSTIIFCDKVRSGIKKVRNILNESTNAVNSINTSNIDYTFFIKLFLL